MSYRKTAAYAKQLANISKKQQYLQAMLSRDEHKHNIEVRRGEDLVRAYGLIETAANTGAIRIFDWNKGSEILFDDDIKLYLINNGFQYTYNSIEWGHAALNNEHK